jgi:UPF0755 protein
MKKLMLIFPVLVAIICLCIYFFLFGPAGRSNTPEIFIIPQQRENFDVAFQLKKQNLIKNPKTFQFIVNKLAKNIDIKPGGYKISQNMNMFKVLSRLTSKPDLVWVTLSYCPRKEQVGEKLAEALNWDSDQLANWNNLFKSEKTENYEGVYYPDIYLIPVDETPVQIAERLINRFNEKFTPLANGYITKNIKWTTGLKIASLIAREAAGKEDMHLVSGIIWNRLNIDMRLQIDSTMQYTLGKRADGSWWGPIDLTEKQSDSPYNTYLHEGLPPTPICSPNFDYLEAALNPEETDCLYYLHDTDSQIHCAKTYKEHLKNIQKYL